MPSRRRRHRFDLNADVNVVSLIDVMLLLLVIFMITAPMMQGGIDITLPSTEARPIESKEGLTVSVNRAGVISIGEESYKSLSEFRIVFRALPKNRTANGVYLRADKNVDYGIVAQLLAAMYAAGVTNVGLITEPEEIK
jgi:biopolymer transport protein ExbD/biopolymer transport protein TolR